MIGGSFVRGVSGGERRRVSIGNEIIINPSLLFLDEPTSGLDSTTALRIVQILHEIAEVYKYLQCNILLLFSGLVPTYNDKSCSSMAGWEDRGDNDSPAIKQTISQI